MEDRVGLVVDQALEHAALRDVAHFRAHTAVAEISGTLDVEQHELGDRLTLAVRALQCAACEQCTRETLAEKSGATGNQYFHDVLRSVQTESVRHCGAGTASPSRAPPTFPRTAGIRSQSSLRSRARRSDRTDTDSLVRQCPTRAARARPRSG